MMKKFLSKKINLGFSNIDILCLSANMVYQGFEAKKSNLKWQQGPYPSLTIFAIFPLYGFSVPNIQ